MKSFEMTHISEIEYNGGLMLGLCGYGASVCDGYHRATMALQSMTHSKSVHPGDWPNTVLHNQHGGSLQVDFKVGANVDAAFRLYTFC